MKKKYTIRRIERSLDKFDKQYDEKFGRRGKCKARISERVPREIRKWARH
jgi:hypothetical protein